jgi:hypothetical protein
MRYDEPPNQIKALVHSLCSAKRCCWGELDIHNNHCTSFLSLEYTNTNEKIDGALKEIHVYKLSQVT